MSEASIEEPPKGQSLGVPPGSTDEARLDAEAGERHQPFHWPLLSPAAATLIFLVVRLFVGLGNDTEASAAGLAGDAAPRTASDRVVKSIPDVSEIRGRRVPETEGELLRLLRKDQAVFFTQGERVLKVPTTEFSLEEAAVIRVRNRASGARSEP